MISYIKGKITSVSTEYIVVEVAGVGYQCYCGVSDLGFFACQSQDKDVTVWTYLSHKEDSMTLYGFADIRARDGFLMLLKVAGIGPKMALRMLSTYNIAQIQAYIDAGDLTSLKKIPGLGAKTAGKLILDLKGKLVLPEEHSPLPTGVQGDLISALVNMGYDEQSVRDCIAEHKIESDDFGKEFKRYIKLLTGRS